MFVATNPLRCRGSVTRTRPFDGTKRRRKKQLSGLPAIAVETRHGTDLEGRLRTPLPRQTSGVVHVWARRCARRHYSRVPQLLCRGRYPPVRQVVDAVDGRIRDMRRATPTGADASEDSKSFVRELNLRYRIVIEMLPRSGFLRVKDEYLAALNENGDPTRRRQPFLSSDGARLTLRLEGQGHPFYHDALTGPQYPFLHIISRIIPTWSPRERNLKAGCFSISNLAKGCDRRMR